MFFIYKKIFFISKKTYHLIVIYKRKNISFLLLLGFPMIKEIIYLSKLYFINILK